MWVDKLWSSGLRYCWHSYRLPHMYLCPFEFLFKIDEEHKTQIELEISLITTWKDTQVQ